MAPQVQEPDDEELFGLIRAVGAGMNIAEDEGLPPAARQVGQDLAEDAAAKLKESTERVPS